MATDGFGLVSEGLLCSGVVFDGFCRLCACHICNLAFPHFPGSDEPLMDHVNSSLDQFRKIMMWVQAALHLVVDTVSCQGLLQTFDILKIVSVTSIGESIFDVRIPSSLLRYCHLRSWTCLLDNNRLWPLLLPSGVAYAGITRVTLVLTMKSVRVLIYQCSLVHAVSKKLALLPVIIWVHQVSSCGYKPEFHRGSAEDV